MGGLADSRLEKRARCQARSPAPGGQRHARCDEGMAGKVTLEIISRCPHCGACHDRAMQVAGREVGPEEMAGAISICVHCGGLAVFNADGSLRPPNAAERRAALRDRGVKLAQEAWAMTMGRKH